MKTKLILHGGFTPGQSQVNDNFFQEILADAPNTSKVLLVYFAKEKDRIEKNRLEDIEQFTKNKGEKTIIFETATENSFLDQVRQSDVVYLHGGHTGKILETIKKFPEFPNLLSGKTVAGDSAGANILVSTFYSKSIGIQNGLGIIPIKLICHCTDENKDKLEEISPSLETLRLHEYEYKVFLVIIGYYL